MPRLNIDSNEFADYVACFLLDKLNDIEGVVPGNEDFNDFSIILKNKGVRAVLLTYYMHMKPQTRVRYRLIKDVFRTDGMMPTADLHIEKSKEIELTKPKKTLLKKVLAAGIAILTGKKILGGLRK